MKVFTQQQIAASINVELAAQALREGFIAYSQGNVKVPPVQHFAFAQANGDCCVKSAWVEGSDTFTVKVSTGFYSNPAKGLPSNSGLMMVLCANTGEPLALLQDEGWLTSLRTALAGRIAARALAPSLVKGIGILGTGSQARLQLEYLMPVTNCRQVTVWGRTAQALADYRQFAQGLGFTVTTTLSAEQVARAANLIVTTTPSREALLRREWIRPGTHITAVGADAHGKQELEPQLVAAADVVVADSIAQCSAFGEVSHAVKAGLLQPSRLVELGQLLAGNATARRDDEQITLVDLTGVAVQDAVIARCAFRACAGLQTGM